MSGRARAVVFHASSVPAGWRRVAADTARARLRFRASWFPPSWREHPRVSFLLGDEYQTLSYVVDWREAWAASPRLDVTLVDVNDSLALAGARRRVREADLVVVLHSAAGDHLGRVRSVEPALQRRRCPLLVLFGNEYAGMPEKIAFAAATGAEFVGTQLPLEAGRWLYSDLPATVLALPAALNPRLYRPLGLERTADIGFRGDRYDNQAALGDDERSAAVELFAERGAELGLRADIQYRRVPRADWTVLLNRWRGIVGAESGTRFLERDGRARAQAVAYLQAHPQVTAGELRSLFFDTLAPGTSVSGKAISSRHFEPLGTETVQVLVEGRYNDILQAGVHYIALARDHSNLGDVVARLCDAGERRRIAEAGRELALGAHTYDHRVAAAVAAALG